MKDLKHLIYFENLLQEANNELVQKAKKDGLRAVGYTCYFMPEVLLDLPGCFSVRLRAPRCTSPDIATYYMSARVCHYARSLLERALEGGFNFLDAQMATETCTATCRFQEHLQQTISSANSPTSPSRITRYPISTMPPSFAPTSCSPCMSASASTSPTRRSARPSRSRTRFPVSSTRSAITASSITPPSRAMSFM